MAGKEKVDIKRSDDFEEVDAELTRAMEELDFTIGRVTAIFEGATDENGPIARDSNPPLSIDSKVDDTDSDHSEVPEAAGDATEKVAVNHLDSPSSMSPSTTSDPESAE